MLVLSVLMNFSSHEKAETHKFLQAPHAGSTSDDMDIFIFFLSHG